MAVPKSIILAISLTGSNIIFYGFKSLFYLIITDA
jgi:hypothetical protein